MLLIKRLEEPCGGFELVRELLGALVLLVVEALEGNEFVLLKKRKKWERNKVRDKQGECV